MPITLSLQGKKVDCPTQGNPESRYIFLTIGPGSLYFPIYSDTLKQHSYFVAYDGPWIHEKDMPVDHASIKAITLQSMVNDIRNAIAWLQANHPGKKIYLLANSIVTGLALKCAESIKELDGTVCIGTPLKRITPDFSHAKEAVPKQKLHELETDLALFSAMKNHDRLDEKLKESNVKDGRLTPISEFVEECQSLRVATLNDYQRYGDVIAHMWRHTPNSPEHVLNIAMRDHFFCESIQNEIDLQRSLDTLNKNHIKIFLAWGERDGVTPYDLDLLKNWPNIPHGIFANAAHFPQLEASEKFDEALLQFIGQKPQARSQALLKG